MQKIKAKRNGVVFMMNCFCGKLFGIFVSKYDGKLQIILQDIIIVSKKNKAYIKYWAIRGQQKNI
jgi:hypothetical protein